jgi:hypothetical protein
MISKGFVAISSQEISDDLIKDYIQSWLSRFDRVEQVSPFDKHANITLHIRSIEDFIPDDQVQFRILHGNQFAWAYITRNRFAIETTGLPIENQISLCLQILLDLPNIAEVIHDTDDARLDDLEAKGIL